MPDRLFPAARANSRLGELELAAKQRAFELEHTASQLSAEQAMMPLSPSGSIALHATEIDADQRGASTDRMFRDHIDTDPGTVERKARQLIGHF